MAMAQASSVEILTLPDGNLTNSSNIDTYFENLVSGWNTEIILLFKVGNLPGASNELVATWSKYALTHQFQQVYRSTGTDVQNVTRNDWIIKTVQGTKYYVCRFGSLN